MSKKGLSEDVDEESLFLESNIPKEFEDLDQTFRCQICASLFDKAVAIRECGHTFCSVCIRNYWVTTRTGIHRQKTACPTCRTPVNVMDVEKALVMNRSIQEGVKAFKQILIRHNKSSNELPGRSLENRRRRKRKSSAPHGDESPASGVEEPASTPSLENRRRSKRKSSATIDDVHHGDESFALENESNGAEEELPIQKKMQSRNYSRMKKRDLQKLCRELKISTSGNEQELIDRLRLYQSMWNAELHSIDPKRPSDIAAKLNSNEKAQQEETKLAQQNGASNAQDCMKHLNASIASGNSKVTSGNATFDKKLKDNFKVMTDALKARMKGKAKLDSSSTNETIDGPLPADKESPKTQLPCEMEQHTPQQNGSLTPSIEVIDVESCPDVLLSSVQTTDKDQNSTSVRPASPQNASPEPTLRTSSISFSTSRLETKPVDQRLMGNRRSDRKKRNSGSSMAWMCGRCTFENKGIDYVCMMCGSRKS